MSALHSIGFVVFGCLTIPKYKQQVLDAYETWVQHALKANCLVRFYVGYIPDDIPDAVKALCVNLDEGDSYMSASWKQWRGLEHILYNEAPCKWYSTFGTDTFIHVQNALKMLADYSHEDSYYIGGGLGQENFNGEPRRYYSGGAGVFLSAPVVPLLLDKLPDFMPLWIASTMAPERIVLEDTVQEKYITAASDMQLGILAAEDNIKWVSQASRMHGVQKWNDKGVDKDTLISCHLMSHDDMHAYYAYLDLR